VLPLLGEKPGGQSADGDGSRFGIDGIGITGIGIRNGTGVGVGFGTGTGTGTGFLFLSGTYLYTQPHLTPL
jgi:hypothetical protein